MQYNSGYGKRRQNKTGNTVPTLKAYEFGKNDVVKTLKVSGEVESTEKNSTITTELVNCKVKTLNVSVGDRVKKDDILCELDTSEIEKEIAEMPKVVMTKVMRESDAYTIANMEGR